MLKAFKTYFISFLFITALLIGFETAIAHAAVPQYLGYEGYLTDTSDDAVTGTYNMTFRIYDALSGGSLLWTETHSNVSVTNGYFSVQLGSVTALTLDFDIPYWISFQLNSDSEMTPRQPINSVGYSVFSDNSYALTDADLDTTIDASTDDQIDIAIAGADDFQFVANILKLLSGSSLETDTINETTGAAGVTIDNITLKDGGSTVVTGGTNTFNITNGTSSLDVAAGSALDVNANLTVELASIVNQDLTTDASVAFTGLSNTDANITAVGDIALDSISSAASNISIGAADATDILQIGDGTYSWDHSPMVGVEGILEVDGSMFADSGMVLAAQQYLYSSTTDGVILLGDTYQTADAMSLLTGSDSRSIIISEYADVTTDFGHAQQTNPTLFIHSADATDTSQWISFAHDQTDGVIDVGTGAVSLVDQLKMESFTNETSSLISAKQTPSVATTNAMVTLEADGTNWSAGSHVLEIISDDSDALPIMINNGSGDVAWFTQGGSLVTGASISLAGGTGTINTTSNGDLKLVPNGSGITIVGDTGVATGHSLAANDDLHVTGKLEVDGSAYFDSFVYLPSQFDAMTLAGGTTVANRFVYGADDGYRLAINTTDGQANSNIIITTLGNNAKDHDHDTLSTDPTLFIHSATDPDTDNAEYLGLTYEGLSAGVMETDRAVFDLTINAVDALPGATVNQDGGKVVLEGGENATGGGADGYVSIGTGSPDHTPDMDSLYVAGLLEVDEFSYFDGDSIYANNKGTYFGNLSSIRYHTGQTNDALQITTPVASESIVIAQIGDTSTDFGHAVQTNPTIFIHSADATDTSQWISFAHNQTNGVIDVGTGYIYMNDGVWFAGSSVYADDVGAVFGGSGDTRVEFDTAQTVDSTIFNLDNTSRTIVFQELADLNTDYEIAAQDDPTLIIHSNDATDIDEYLSLAHEGANNYAVIKTGDSSDIKFESSILAGAYEFTEDAGFLTAMDMSVSATPAAGTQESYTFKIDGNSFLKIYSEADSAGSIENGSIRFYEPVVYLPSSDQEVAEGGTVTCTDTITRVSGDADGSTTGATAITDGTEDGQFCIIEGTDDTETVTVTSANNTALSGGNNFILGIGDTLTVIWDSGDSLWYEISRSDN